MKKLLLSSVVLFLFSLSILIFQISCKKSAKADEVQSEETSLMSLWKSGDSFMYVAKIDGTIIYKIPLPEPPVGYSREGDPNGKITANQKNIVFNVSSYKSGNGMKYQLYVCSIDGSNLKELTSLEGYQPTDVK